MRKTEIMTKLKRNEAITLIALVITIIVLLILAGVAISMLSGENGILTRAADSKTSSEKASEEEAVQLAAMTALTVGKGQIKGIDAFNALNTGLDEAGYTGDDIAEGDLPAEILINGNRYIITEDGQATYLTWYYTEDKTKITNGIQELEVGATVLYDCTKDSKEKVSTQSYTSPVEKNGFGNQTYKATEYEGGWKVLGVDEFGKVQLIPTSSVYSAEEKEFCLGTTGNAVAGQNGYQYGVSELNKICAIYGHGKGASSARSITIEDVDRLTSGGALGRFTEADAIASEYVTTYGKEVTYTYESEGKTKYTYLKGEQEKSGTVEKPFTYLNSNGKWVTLKQGDTGVTLKCTALPKVGCGDYFTSLPDGMSENAYDLIFNENLTNFWLGSSVIFTDVAFGARFGISTMLVGDKSISYYPIVSSEGTSYGRGYTVVPLVSLQGDVEFGGNATTGWIIK